MTPNNGDPDGRHNLSSICLRKMAARIAAPLILDVRRMSFERVYTVWDYYDGPRTGLADYNGRPHYYVCEWNAGMNNYADGYRLSPVDHETIQLALEQWQIWRTWEYAFHTGEVPQESHPGNGGKDARYDDLEVALHARLAKAKPLPLTVRGVFRPAGQPSDAPRGVMMDLEVEWTDGA